MAESLYVTVKDKRRGITRSITKRAYQLQQSRYELLNGEVSNPPQKKKEVKAAAPVEAEVFDKSNPGGATVIEYERNRLMEEGKIARENLLKRLDAATQQAPAPEKPPRKKPGPKPKPKTP
jgi:hypothetical protein